MRKRDQQKQQYYLDIFEPAPQWPTTTASNNGASGGVYQAHSPTHRSPPIHHQPSLSEIVYQDYNTEIQDVYPIYQDRRQHQYIDAVSSVTTTYDSSLHTLSIHSELNNQRYDDYDDEESVDKGLRHQSDNVSLSQSLFTAVDHLEIADNDDDRPLQEEEAKEEDDDSSSTENARHGYLPTTQPSSYQEYESINVYIKQLNVETSIVWEDDRPPYRLLSESYDNVKKEIYKEIYATMEKMQELDHKFHQAKLGFQTEMENNYLKMTDKLLFQCKDLVKEQEFIEKSIKQDQEEISRFQNEKVRLNVGGNIFETSLSTLLRDTNSLLATMFSGRHSILPDESDGATMPSFFIDRDPSHFRLVLNYLRDLRIPPTILQDVKIRQELLQEAKYYCIDGLVSILQ